MASKIKESFMGDKGLAGMIRKQPIEKVYDLGNVKQVCASERARGVDRHPAEPAGPSSGALVLLPHPGLAGRTLLPLSPQAHVQMTRQADGYQPHLVSPETGMRRLASEALDFVAGPVGATVQQVYTLLLNAAR